MDGMVPRPRPAARRLPPCRGFPIFLLAFLATFPGLAAPVQGQVEPPRVLPPEILPGVAREDMVSSWLRARTDAAAARWREDYEATLASGDWTARDARLRAGLRAALGGLPAERTPLNPRVTGTLEGAGFRVENLLFESQPGFFVTANLYLPASASAAAPVPGVLLPCGHAAPAKAHDEYQAAGALLARHGMAALVFDPVDQGERYQRLDPTGRPLTAGTAAHLQEGTAAALLGWNLMRIMAWDGLRALDLLASRPEVDPTRLGITGNSGGGTQTSFIFNLDDRLQVAAPSCYIHSHLFQVWAETGDSEQHAFGQAAFGFEHADFFLTRAPAPILLLTATQDFFSPAQAWETARLLQRRYSQLGYSGRAAIMENLAGHNYNRDQREAMAAWMSRWLLRRDAVIREGDQPLFTADQLRVTPEGQVLRLPGARSLWDLLRDEAARLRAARSHPAPGDDALRASIAALLGADPDRWPALGNMAPTLSGQGRGAGFRWESYVLRRRRDPLFLPLVLFTPDPPAPAELPVLLATPTPVGELTREPGLAEVLPWLQAGRTVAAFNPSGLGETRQSGQGIRGEPMGADFQDWMALHVLGSSTVALRVDDIFLAARWLQESHLAPRGFLLAGFGEAGVPALHAAFLEPARFPRLHLRGALQSWQSILDLERSYQRTGEIVPGALPLYDLPDLVARLGDRVTVEIPVDPLGLDLLDPQAPPPPGDHLPTLPGLIGLFFGNPARANPQSTDVLTAISGEFSRTAHFRGGDWAADWSGFLLAPASGPVEFRAEADWPFSVELDGRPLLALDPRGHPAETTAVRTLTAGQALPFTVQYEIQTGGTGFFRLSWRTPGGAWQAVDAALLRHTPASARAARVTLFR